MNAISAPGRATIDDLMRVEGKAELIDGRVVRLMSPGRLPNIVSGRIYVELLLWIRAAPGRGEAYVETMSFAVPMLASRRESFQPDVAYAVGPFAADPMDAHPGPPLFAVEVRSKDDYGPARDRDCAAKRADYFEAGTLVVWDVDPLARTIACHRAADPLAPQVFGPGEAADAEPAVPGWRVRVDDVMMP